MRVVLDTNVLVSALIRPGKPRRLLDTTIGGPHRLLLSKAIIEELARVLGDQRIRRYASEEDCVSFMRILTTAGTLVKAESHIEILKSEDDRILETAYDGDADIIVTGDGDLLDLAEFKNIRIVTVSDAITILT